MMNDDVANQVKCLTNITLSSVICFLSYLNYYIYLSEVCVTFHLL